MLSKQSITILKRKPVSKFLQKIAQIEENTTIKQSTDYDAETKLSTIDLKVQPINKTPNLKRRNTHARSATQINFKPKVTFGAKELGHIRRNTLLNLS